MTALLRPDEIDWARRLARHDDLAPARGILTGVMIGAAIWTVIGLVLYFTFFGGM